MLATVAALCYKNGLENPLAHFGKGGPSDKLGLVTAEAILGLAEDRNPMIADPLRLHDCSLVTDGAAALVIMRSDAARKRGKPAVEIAGIGHTTERLPINVRPNMYELMAGKEAAKRAFAEANITAKDIDIAEVHDCFTINQLLCTEALGFSADGKPATTTCPAASPATTRCASTCPAASRPRDTPWAPPALPCTPCCTSS